MNSSHISRMLKAYAQSLFFKSEQTDASASPLFYLPNWQLPDGRNVEIAINGLFALVQAQSNNHSILFTAQEKKSLPLTFFQWLQILESHQLWPSPFFYLFVLSYDFGLTLHDLTAPHDFYRLPEWYLLLPGSGYIRDLKNQHTLTFGLKDCDYYHPEPTNFTTQRAFFEQNESVESYRKKIKTIKQLIAKGEFYQLNFTMRFSKNAKAPGFVLFNDWYQRTQAPRSFFLNVGELQLLSISPERFWAQQGRQVFTEPIKGTIKRASTPLEDEQRKQRLLRSSKDKAELNMITDLLRNDLSKVCVAGSVRVQKQHELRTFSHVHHLVSTVRGTLRNAQGVEQLIRATFPGGSITGCPKRAAMHYINQLEQHNRSFYTGSLFLRFPLQNVTDSSILIRTALLKNNVLHYQAGGGIVIDSKAQTEFEECLAKASLFLHE